MSAYAKELSTAEIAYAAIEEVISSIMNWLSVSYELDISQFIPGGAAGNDDRSMPGN